MNFLIATFVFILTIGLTFTTIASEPDAACTAENTTKCADTDHKDLSGKMNSLFPEKQKITKLTTAPRGVELIAPKFLAKVVGAAKLEWKVADGANTYHLQVATDPNFKWLVAEEHFVKTTSYEFSKSEAGRKYFWRVAAYNTDNEAMYAKSYFASSVFVAK